MRPIFLVGMPGVGKSYWGKQLAEAYKLSFIDLDAYIEHKEERSISSIFEGYGEDGFRAKEQEALQDIIQNNVDSIIVACGGGTPIYAGNMQMMLQAGIVVYLKAPVSLLLKNLHSNLNVRPLLQAVDIEAKLKELLNKRKTIYEKANYILDAGNLSVPNFAEILKRCTDQPY